MIKIIFVHGWGFHPGVWVPLVRQLEKLLKFQPVFVDLGFASGGPDDAIAAGDDLPANAICIGHSLGVMWLLKSAPRPIKALVSIGGFDCFHAHIPLASIEAIKQGLDKNLKTQMSQFWSACGTMPFVNVELLDKPALAQGLDWLIGWDGRTERTKLSCPVLALAARDDIIVPEKMSRDIWTSDELVFCKTGAHALPLTQPQWCATQITAMAQKLVSSS